MKAFHNRFYILIDLPVYIMVEDHKITLIHIPLLFLKQDRV
jgi:hypothetical protein